MSLSTTLFPPANREAATVAFLRTAWQVIRATGGLGGVGVIAVSASGLASINWPTVGYAAAAVVLSAIFSGLLAAGNILANGLPGAYQAAAIVAAPAAAVAAVAASVSPFLAPVVLPTFAATVMDTPSILPAEFTAANDVAVMPPVAAGV